MAEYWAKVTMAMNMTTKMKMIIKRLLCSLVCSLLLVGGAAAQQAGSLDQEIQSIKQQTLALNRDLFILEEELLFPDDSRLAVFLSLDVGEFFSLDAVKLSIDGAQVTHYLYTAQQVNALVRGGVHRLYMGNVKSGEHEIVAVFTGKGPQGRDYRRATELIVDKTNGSRWCQQVGDNPCVRGQYSDRWVSYRQLLANFSLDRTSPASGICRLGILKPFMPTDR